MIFSEYTSGSTVQDQDISSYKTQVKAPKYLYLLAGTHGDEVEGVYVLKKLFDWLKDEHSMSDLPIVVVPILNLDGYQAGTRVNSHAVDLNRNYPSKDWKKEFKKEKYNPGPAPLSEPENQFLIKLFDKLKPALVISFHTWKPLVNFNGDCEEVANYIGGHNNYKVVPEIGYPTPGSLGSFVPEKYGAGVITFECPQLGDDKTLESIWLENEKGLKGLFTENIIRDKYFKK